jgi:eukaryotic-like serine/threonine-protein kinase
MSKFIAAISFGLVILFVTGNASAATTTVPNAATSKFTVSTVTVPNVVGLSTTEARERLAAVKIGVEKLEPEITADRALKDKVKSQSLAAGQQVQVPTRIILTVYVTYAPGVATVIVPNLIGMTKDEAKKAAAAAGLAVSTEGTPVIPTSDQKLIGRIASHQPLAGKVTVKGNAVRLDLYGPQPMIEVPNEIGKSGNLAIASLENKGFVAKREESPTSDSKLFGTVIRQDPAAGAKAPKQSTVTVYVAMGMKQFSVPNVVGMKMDEATKTVRGVGLDTGSIVAQVLTGDRTKFHLVAEQTPAAGARVSEGTKVYLKEYKPDVVAVPNVLTWPTQHAQTTLRDAGFVTEVREGKGPSANLTGKVFRQDPPHGSPVLRGTTVTIYVGSK